MKTPTQELIDEISKIKNNLIEYVELRNSQGDDSQKEFYDGKIHALERFESKLRDRYLEKEKDLIVASYYYGWHDGHNYIDTMPKTGFEPEPLYKNGEDFYNKKFKQ